MERAIQEEISLSWLIVTTRDYKPEYEWYWDKKHHCVYGILLSDRHGSKEKDLLERYGKGNINRELSEDYFNECILMPELHFLEIEEAAEYLRRWCDYNSISYKEDLDEYKKVEAYYWGFDDIYA
ncbi:MAG: hypothetical protein K6C96_10195 [Butyrivibrio sp.]|nr:hypothetical protein [Butyrivibrio sp.]